MSKPWLLCGVVTGLYLVYPWLHAHEYVLILLFIALLFALIFNAGRQE